MSDRDSALWYRGELTDLIAALWATAEAPNDWHRVEQMYRATHRAEQRLKGLDSDE